MKNKTTHNVLKNVSIYLCVSPGVVQTSKNKPLWILQNFYKLASSIAPIKSKIRTSANHHFSSPLSLSLSLSLFLSLYINKVDQSSSYYIRQRQQKEKILCSKMIRFHTIPYDRVLEFILHFQLHDTESSSVEQRAGFSMKYRFVRRYQSWEKGPRRYGGRTAYGIRFN